MHEFSIASSIIDIVNRTARENGISRVTRVTVRVGELRLVLPESLKFAFRVCAKGSVAENGEIQIEKVPATGKCSSCGNEFRVGSFQFVCPSCGSADMSIVSGEELLVESLEGE
jgi:hydrogenase nickel incorporation protein HypA/HybF